MAETTSPDTKPADQAAIEAAIDQATLAVNVHSAQLDQLLPGANSGPSMGIAQLLDVPVRVSVEVGRARVSLGELAELAQGALITLDRLAHEPADILVNGKVVAQGEIVTIGDNYGVRVTSVNRGA